MTLNAKPIGALARDIFDMRKADKEECRAGGMTPRQAVDQSIKLSLHCEALWAGDELVALWGYAPTSFLGGTCNAWLLTSPAVETNQIAFLRWSKDIVRKLLTLYPNVCITVHCKHKAAIKWVKWLGFHRDRFTGEFQEMRAVREEGFKPWVF